MIFPRHCFFISVTQAQTCDGDGRSEGEHPYQDIGACIFEHQGRTQHFLNRSASLTPCHPRKGLNERKRKDQAERTERSQRSFFPLLTQSPRPLPDQPDPFCRVIHGPPPFADYSFFENLSKRPSTCTGTKMEKTTHHRRKILRNDWRQNNRPKAILEKGKPLFPDLRFFRAAFLCHLDRRRQLRSQLDHHSGQQ